MGTYSVNNSLVDRAQHGTLKSLVPAGVATGIGAAATMLGYTKRGGVGIKGPSPMTAWIGLTAGASVASGIIASHAFNGSPDARFGVAIGATALPAAIGAGLIAKGAGLSALKAGGVVAATAVAAAGVSFALNSVLLSR